MPVAQQRKKLYPDINFCVSIKAETPEDLIFQTFWR
jgi:hypothetical protein